MNQLSCVLTIAGTDPTGGAGIQADLKTFQELKSYGMSVITSVVAQNTTGVQGVHHMPLSMIEEQLDSVIDDIPVQAFKTGMIANVEMMEIIKRRLVRLNAPYVMDPVMVTTSGDVLIPEDARLFLRDELLPLTTVVTPNIFEAEHLLQRRLETLGDMKEAAQAIVERFGVRAALITGGHMKGDPIDVLYDGSGIHTFPTERIDTPNTHGTGCTLSAAITAYLGQGHSLFEAIEKAKKYMALVIRHSLDIGHGSGPTNHWAPRMKDLNT